MKMILIGLGLLLIFEGMPWFLSPASVRSALARLATLSDRRLRGLGLLCMLAGLLLVFLARY